MKEFETTKWIPPTSLISREIFAAFIIVFISLYFPYPRNTSIEILYQLWRWIYFIGAFFVVLGMLTFCRIFNTHGMPLLFWKAHRDIFMKWERFSRLSLKFILDQALNYLFIFFVYFYLRDYALFVALCFLQMSWALYVSIMETSRREYIYCTKVEGDNNG